MQGYGIDLDDIDHPDSGCYLRDSWQLSLLNFHTVTPSTHPRTTRVTFILKHTLHNLGTVE